MNNYRKTLNLPKTDFSMKANLVNKEPKILKKWIDKKLYNVVRKAKIKKKKFILHDGPPYANGNIHLGHAVNKILKDIIIKSKGLEGFDSPYIPGWDCHGLPIEHEVEKIIRKSTKVFSQFEFHEQCRKYAEKQIEVQKIDFIRMGILGDWKNPYLTMDFKVEANIIRSLGKIIRHNHLTNGIKPVHWCTLCKSSLAESELEYQEKLSVSLYVCFRAVNLESVYLKFNIKNLKNIVSMVIWTTSPWTLPANRAIAVNPKFKYQLVKISHRNELFILEASSVKLIENFFKTQKLEILAECFGFELEYLRFYHPFMDFDVPVILSNHVISESGTGIVHIAPGHGPEDYILSKKYNIEIINLVDSSGVYLKNIDPILNGISIFQSNQLILNLLNKNCALFYKKKIMHNYPICWRHKSPTIFRTTPQWFISMEKNDLRIKSLKEIENVEWIPNWGKKRIKSMLFERPDWCISRQRSWGVPITLFIHKDTGKLHPNTLQLIEEIAIRVEQSGTQWWFSCDPKIFLYDDADKYLKILDTLDVWFDSGSTSYSVFELFSAIRNNSIDLCLEGSDQYRGWFMSSLLFSVATREKAPYKKVLTHGFIVDKTGKKMSKSLKNVISPKSIMENFGADILRLWASSINYTNEISISNESLKRVIDNYRRIRNTVRFLLGNLDGFNPKKHIISPKDMTMFDCWAINHTKKVQYEIIQNYFSYNFSAVVKTIVQFCSIEMGSIYLEITKDRQYTSKKGCIAHRSCQTAFFHILESLVKWISPILSFTADEIWNKLPGHRSEFIFTEEYYNGFSNFHEDELYNNKFWSEMFKIRNVVNKFLENMRDKKIISIFLEASVTLYVTNRIFKLLSPLRNELHFFFLISKLKLSHIDKAPSQAKSTELDELKIYFEKAEGIKCSRCWNYFSKISSSRSKYIDLCNRCVSNVLGNGEIRRFI